MHEDDRCFEATLERDIEGRKSDSNLQHQYAHLYIQKISYPLLAQPAAGVRPLTSFNPLFSGLRRSELSSRILSS